MGVKEGKNLKIGYNSFWEDREKPGFYVLLQEKNKADFVFCHFDVLSDGEQTLREAKEMAELFSAKDVEFIVNVEQANTRYELKETGGYEWTNHEDGTHRFEFTKELIDAFASSKKFVGIAYDEFEHCIINRNLGLRLSSKGKYDIPVFALTDGKDFLKQGELLDSQLKDYADRNRYGYDISVAGEHVFPVLYHKFAKSGITPNFKSQKESYSNVQFAIAAGAALQYGTELWNCVDLWYRMNMPGHSADEMYANLVFSYLAGTHRVYVEHAGMFFTDGNLNEYGENYCKFLGEYKGKERGYDVSDYEPLIGVIKYDDTFWGQGDPVAWRPILFGNKKIKVDRKAKEFVKAVHTITHGETSKKAVNWNRISPWSLRPHRSFSSMNSAAVFDENVKYETLSSLKLCFLCGYYISPETLAAVEKLVRENGLTVITSKRFLPEGLRSVRSSEIEDGRGKWVVTSNMAGRRAKKAARPFIGKKGEINLRFAGKEIKLKINKTGEGFAFDL